VFAIAVTLLAVRAARAVVFDIGGVLEVPVDTHLDGRWEQRLGLEPGAFLKRLRHFQRLRPRYRTGILSNAAAGGRRQEQMRYGFDDLADLTVYSYEVGIEKPDRRIYLLTCERLGVHPGEVVFLDDLEANVAAARGVGMRAVLFQTTAQAITDMEACLAHSTG
jgi:FMN phosphatase YigB (HAD superfamily)